MVIFLSIDIDLLADGFRKKVVIVKQMEKEMCLHQQQT